MRYLLFGQMAAHLKLRPSGREKGRKYKVQFKRNMISLITVVGLLLFILTANASAQDVEVIYPESVETPETTNFEQALRQLASLGMDTALLNNVKVEVYPGEIIAYKQGDKIGMTNCLTVSQINQNTGTIEARITLAKGADVDMLLHELGHVVEAKLGSVNGSWVDANDMGKAYIIMKQYTKELDQANQMRLSWYERLSEWFAEDVRQFLAQKISPGYYYKGVGPEKTKEVDEFLEKLIF